MIDKKFMFIDLEAQTDLEALGTLGKIAVEENIVSESFVEAIVFREKEYPTALPVKHGVAIPHTDGIHVKEDKLLIASLKKPVSFYEMGGDEEDKVDVSLIIMLAISEGGKHLSVLQRLIGSIQNNDFVEGLIKAESSEEMERTALKYIDEKEIVS